MAVSTKRKPAAAPKRKQRGKGRPAGDGAGVGREVLLAKTCELLRKMPPEKVTRAEVARYINVDPSLIRYYFQDRSSLLVAAAEQLTKEFSSNLEAAIKQSDNTPLSLLRARVTTLFDLNLEHPYFHRLLTQEIVPSTAPAAKKMVEDMTRGALAGYDQILANGTKNGTLKPARSVYLLLAIIGMCEFFNTGLPFVRMAAGKKLDEEAAAKEYREFICELVLNGLSPKAK